MSCDGFVVVVVLFVFLKLSYERMFLLKQTCGRMFYWEQTCGVFLEAAWKMGMENDVLLEWMLERTHDVWKEYKCNPTESG